MKIVDLSKYGFKLDSLRSDWLKVDRSLLNRSLFLGLVKGQELKDLVYNDKGFITSFSVVGAAPDAQAHIESNSPLLKHLESSSLSGTDSSPSSPNNNGSSSPLPDIDKRIRYAQCVNLAFNNLSSRQVNLDWKNEGKFPMIELGFDLADSIFNEWNKR